MRLSSDCQYKIHVQIAEGYGGASVPCLRRANLFAYPEIVSPFRQRFCIGKRILHTLLAQRTDGKEKGDNEYEPQF